VEAATGGSSLRRPLNGRWRRGNVAGLFARRGELLSLFAKAGANLQETAEQASHLLLSWPDNEELVGQVTRCEQEGDRLTREIIHRLHRSRIGPGDRGDIYALAEAIDDVVDEIEETSEQLVAYSIEAPMEQAQELVGVVRDSARAVRRALDRFRDGDDVQQQVMEVRDLEHEGDRIYRQAVASLFDGGIDPMLVIRWKDILEGLENAIDRSRQAMDILHGFVLKHS
jgi:predicted phosphate transport protein (TIGR00153 family)